MSTIDIQSNSTEMTEQIGHIMGQHVLPGTVVALDGDLGAGKTVFARGIARGMGISDDVRSPTYTIVIEHLGMDGGPNLYHFDTYRLEDEEDFIAAGLDEYFDQKSICVIEWSEKISAILPKDAIHVRIEGVGVNRSIKVTLSNDKSTDYTELQTALSHYL